MTSSSFCTFDKVMLQGLLHSLPEDFRYIQSKQVKQYQPSLKDFDLYSLQAIAEYSHFPRLKHCSLFSMFAYFLRGGGRACISRQSFLKDPLCPC